MSYKDVDRFLEHTTLDGKAWQVMAVICHHANFEAGVAWPSQDTLATKAKCSTKTVQRAVQQAVAAGELVVIPGRGRGNLTRYVVLVGLSEAEQQERLTRNGLKVDTSCPVLAAEKVDTSCPVIEEKADANPTKSGHFDRRKVDILDPKVDISGEKVDSQMSTERVLEQDKKQNPQEEREREEKQTPSPLNLEEFRVFLERFYALTGKKAAVKTHREAVEPVAVELYQAGYRMTDLESAEAATSWMVTPPTPRQVALSIGGRQQGWSQFGDQKGDYSAFFAKSGGPS